MVGRGRATISLISHGSAALPAAVTSSAMSSAGRFQRRSRTTATESGARIANDPAFVTIPAIEVTVASRWAATPDMISMSRPGLSVLTPNPTNAAMTASARKTPRTRVPNVTSPARLLMRVPEACRRDHPKPGRHDLEDPREFSSDLAVERHIHRIGWPNLQPRNLERANATDAAADAHGGIDRGPNEAPDRQGVGHGDGEGSGVRGRTPGPPGEGTAGNRRPDHRDGDEKRLLPPVFPLHLAA